jgi:hypothetical protein
VVVCWVIWDVGFLFSLPVLTPTVNERTNFRNLNRNLETNPLPRGTVCNMSGHRIGEL